jgi:hypothetical protein
MDERWTRVNPEAEEKQERKFAAWLSGEGIPFGKDGAREAFQERVTLLKDAIQMKKAPRRVPVCPSAGFFPIQYAGLTMHQAMYDYDKLAQAWRKYCFDFSPDAFNSPSTIVPGRTLEALDVLYYQWPGHGVGREQDYQYVEKEYMRPEEYQDLIDDPTGFFLNIYLPRICGSLKPFERFPFLPGVNEIPGLPPATAPFGSPEFKAALEKLMEAGRESVQWLSAVRGINESVMAQGFPSFSGGFTKAPFDLIGDTLRGTRGVLMDIFRRPDELLEACQRVTPLMVKAGVSSCRATGHIMPFIPLHKGADGFMSDEQFKTFYWPSLRKLIIGLINEGLVPQLFAEGGYNQRLEVISDLPRGKVLWWLDQTDMVQAKRTVGRVACLAGNVPLALLCTGEPEEVTEYCRRLIETAGQNGGFIFSTGAGMQGAKPENVKAMVEAAKLHGATG